MTDDLDEAMDGAERDVAAARLAGYLRTGQLSLLLGAGVSRGLGLPDWGTLVERCERRSGVTPEVGLDLMRRMDVVRRTYRASSEFQAVVHDELYAELAAAGEYPDSLLQSRMLIALGALVMSSVRGSVTDVLTLNFDDVLDWYLHLHGFRTQVVTQLPQLVSARTDVRILHLHGFLPLMPKFQASDWLVLTHDELINRLSDHTAPWPVLIANMLQSKVLLAVGTSMNDIDLDVLVRRASIVIRGVRPVGYVLTKKISSDRAAALREWGIQAVSFDEFEQVPVFLLNICQRAAGDSSHSVHMRHA